MASRQGIGLSHLRSILEYRLQSLTPAGRVFRCPEGQNSTAQRIALGYSQSRAALKGVTRCLPRTGYARQGFALLGPTWGVAPLTPDPGRFGPGHPARFLFFFLLLYQNVTIPSLKTPTKPHLQRRVKVLRLEKQPLKTTARPRTQQFPLPPGRGKLPQHFSPWGTACGSRWLG
jgi:hypothetical protein